MKHLISILLSLFLFISIAHSQNPGLLGKHYILHYNFDYQFGIYNSLEGNWKEEGFVRYLKLIQGRHELGNEYVFSRWQSVQADYVFFWGRDFNNQINYNAHEIALSYKHYFVKKDGGAIAPLGNYWRPKAFVTLASYTPKIKYGNGFQQVPFVGTKRFVQYGASIEMGRQSVIFKKFMLDMGVSFGWTFFTKKETKAFTKENDYYESNFGRLFNESPYKQILLSRIISFRIGFGLPLF